MRALVFGGTTEGRLLAQGLTALGVDVTVSVATALGAEELKGLPGLTVLVGRLEMSQIVDLLAGFHLCIDATHPYAVLATRNIREACGSRKTPLLRLLRAESPVEGCLSVDSPEQAAAYLAQREGNVLLATGAKALPHFAGLDKGRLFVRVLPTHESLDACEHLGVPHRNILALQGPFTQKMNEAMMEQYAIRYLVTKDGGAAGGFQEKLAAAQHAGAELILIRRPPEDGHTFDEILQKVREMLA